MDFIYLPLAGCIGALVTLLTTTRITKLTKARFWVDLGRLFSGSSTAHYLTPLAINYFSLSTQYQQSVAFLIGIGSMQIIATIHKKMHEELDSSSVVDLIKSAKK